MKQIKEMFDRHFAGEKPLKKKWQVRELKPNRLYIFHYQHLILIVDIKELQVLYSWWQTKADKRGLDSCMAQLTNRFADVKKVLQVSRGETIHG